MYDYQKQSSPIPLFLSTPIDFPMHLPIFAIFFTQAH